MGNSSLHSRLAQALAKAGSYVPEESSPYGAKPVKPIRHPASVPNVPRISNVADLIAEDYIAPTVQGAKAVGGFVREHPAETVAGVAAGLTLPVSAIGLAGAGALGLTGRAIDKTHPLTDEKSDYSKQSSKDIAKDLLISGGVNSLAHGIFGTAIPRSVPKTYDMSALGDAVSANGAIREFGIPEPVEYVRPEKYIPAPAEFGHPEGMLDIMNHEAFPQAARDASAELIAQGHPRWIPGPVGSGLEGKTVLNPVHKFDPRTPEGIEYYGAGGKENPTILYSAGKSTNNPYMVAKEYPAGVPLPQGKTYTAQVPRTDENGVKTIVIPKWVTESKPQAKSYLRRDPSLPSPFQTDEASVAYRNALQENIANGRITEKNLPEGFKSVGEVEDYIYSPLAKGMFADPTGGFHTQNALKMLYDIGDPRATGSMQELISLAKNPMEIDLAGGYWSDLANAAKENPHVWQQKRINEAIAAGHDELKFLNSVDPGNSTYALDKAELLGKLHREPADVTVGYDPTLYISPYGLGPIKRQGNPMNVIPLAAGLGAGIVANSRQE